ncbi:MAG: YfcE family phosphodiesterase [Methanosarcinales archaeon]|nr:YfcE family phosphodiesterase [Methanosarcinales archaeon]
MCPHLDIQQHLVNACTPPICNPANQFRLPHIQQVSRLNPVIACIEHHQVIEVEGVKVGVIHKDQMTSDHAEDLRYLAKEMDVDVLIFGHFHHPIIEEFEMLLLSPGSAIVPGIAEFSDIELDIFEGRIRGKVIRCDGNVCGYFEYGVK